jgi:RimJ/RimL family protein N-acetyltransferase
VDIKGFAQFHTPSLEIDEVRNNLILTILAKAQHNPACIFRAWSLGAPGACAVQNSGRPIVLGELDRQQCCALADQVRDLDFPGVVGSGQTAVWFAERAGALGIDFADPIPQQIHVIRGDPRYPGADGVSRVVASSDEGLVAEWLLEFSREALPHEPEPDRKKIQKASHDGQHMFWTVNNLPVSIAGIVRQTKHGVAIGNVYTPPRFRGQGYAGSVTAALIERAYAGDKLFVCLYTDLRNPFSNRCYAKVGFEPVCASWHYPRVERYV